jgi:CPA2 family monovalent cation:H+ antiporter-2
MLLDLPFMIKSWPIVLGGGIAIIAIKFLIAIIAVLLLGFSLRTSVLVGFALSQIGEFSFILSKVGYDYKLLSSFEYQSILAMSIITMVISSFILNYSGPLISFLMKNTVLDWMDKKTYRMSRVPIKPEDENLYDHLIIIGYGINGRNVSKSARIAGIPYLIIETNPETVIKELARGEKIIYGDASNEEVLAHAKIKSARVLVTTIPDAPSARRVIFTARKLNPDVYIIARTRFVKEVNDLFALGASEVIPEEFETSVEIFTRLLRKFNIPENDISDYIEIVRSDGYQMFRTASIESITPPDQRNLIKGMDVVTYRVEKGSAAEGRSIIDLAIRKQYGVTILAIYKGGNVIQNPDAETVLDAEDIVMLVGLPSKINNACVMFKRPWR